MTVLDPEDLDWRIFSDLQVALSAHSGIPEAVAEAKRRGIEPLDIRTWQPSGEADVNGWTPVQPEAVQRST